MEEVFDKKSLVFKILLILLMLICTGIFLYFLIGYIQGIILIQQQIAKNANDLKELAFYNKELSRVIAEFIQIAFLYLSFLAIAIPTVIKLFRLRVKNGVDEPIS